MVNTNAHHPVRYRESIGVVGTTVVCQRVTSGTVKSLWRRLTKRKIHAVHTRHDDTRRNEQKTYNKRTHLVYAYDVRALTW
jgi:hypothetical protein